MATVTKAPDHLLGQNDAIEQRLLLHDVSWDSYIALGKALRDRSGLHIHYDRGMLELMTPSYDHEEYKTLFLLLIGVWAEELNISLKCFGSATHRRKDIQRGAEPDQCFYVKNLARIRGKRRINLLRDPPPDLVIEIEIEITRSAIDKLELYAAFGVPEIWRFNGERLQIDVLGRNGRYRNADRSLAFPTLPIEEFVRFVHMAESEDDISLVRAFRQWVRERFVK